MNYKADCKCLTGSVIPLKYYETTLIQQQVTITQHQWSYNVSLYWTLSPNQTNSS